MLLALLLMGAAALLLLPGCTVSRPFQGPGFERGKGVTVDVPGGEVLVALTRGRLERRTRGGFDRNIPRVEDALGDAPGLIGFALRKELFGPRVWTMTVWTDEASMAAFVRGDVHRRAMDEGGEATVEFEFARAWVGVAEVPLPWERAEELLDAAGAGYGGAPAAGAVR